MPLQNCKISQMARWKIVYINEKSFFSFATIVGHSKIRRKEILFQLDLKRPCQRWHGVPMNHWWQRRWRHRHLFLWFDWLIHHGVWAVICLTFFAGWFWLRWSCGLLRASWNEGKWLSSDTKNIRSEALFSKVPVTKRAWNHILKSNLNK